MFHISDAPSVAENRTRVDHMMRDLDIQVADQLISTWSHYMVVIYQRPNAAQSMAASLYTLQNLQESGKH